MLFSQEGSARAAKPQQRWKMLLYVGAMMLVSWALYHVFFKARITDTMEEASFSHHLDGTGETEQIVPPTFPEMIQVLNLPAKQLPPTGKHRGTGRLIVVGDVHGMLHELLALLDKVQFDKNSDHLILAGDLIAKGPDSPGVVDLVMSLGATAVRGNHEDRVILAHAAMGARNELFNPPRQDKDIRKEKYDLEESGLTNRESKDRTLAILLGDERIRWLTKCPVILKVGKLEDMGETVVVHAGLEPGVTLQDQDPYMAMNMRTISKSGLPSDKHKGDGWMKTWNRHQENLPKSERTTVIYGHDSKRGLQMERYSMGIDTGCVKGGRLTAVVIEGGYSEHKFKLVQIDCPIEGKV